MEKKRVAVPLVCHDHSRPVVDLFYTPITLDGFFLFSASKDSNPMLRNGETSDWIGTFEGHKGVVCSCCLDTNALRAASGSADFSAGVEKVLRIFDLNRPDAPPREVDKSPGSIRTVAWLHSDQTILSSCTDMGGVRLWDLRTGKIVQTLETKSSVTSAEVSQDGRYITNANGSTIKFWDANHFGLVKSYNIPCTIESASLEPKYGNKFIAGGEDMWIRVFDFHTGDEIACNKGHHGPVHCVHFSLDRESYASGLEDGTIRIWQTGPLIHDDTEAYTANGSLGKKKATADEVSHKIELVQVADEGKNKDKEEAVNECHGQSFWVTLKQRSTR